MKKVKLSSICNIASGGTPARSNSAYWKNGTIPWVKIGDITDKLLSQTSEHITQEGLNSSSAKLFPKGTILYTIFATLGEVAILNIAATTNQAIAGICLNDSRFTIQYLYYYLTSLKDYVNNIGRGVAQNNINLSILKNFEIPLRTLPEQEHIVESLTRVEQVIALRRAQLAKLDELVKCRFVELFGDPGSNPRKWPIVTVQDIVTEVKYGTSRPAVAGGKYPYLRMNNITYDGKLDLSDVKRIDVPDDELPKCTVKRGDILFNRTNSKELVGKTCLYDKDELMVLAGFIIRVRVNELVIPEFVVQFMNMPTTKALLFAMCRNAVSQANINAKELQSISIYLPSLDIQKQFSAFTHRIDKLRKLGEERRKLGEERRKMGDKRRNWVSKH